MTHHHSLLTNPHFLGISNQEITSFGAICEGWTIEGKNITQDAAFTLSTALQEDRNVLCLDVEKTASWLRISQKLSLHEAQYRHLSFRISFSGSSSRKDPAKLLVALLEVDGKGHAIPYIKLVGYLPIREEARTIDRVVQVGTLRADREYYFAIQISKTCHLEISELEAQLLERFTPHPEAELLLKEKLERAATRKATLAPYKDYEVNYYQTLRELNEHMSARGKQDIHGLLGQLLLVALRLESYHTALQMVEYLLTLPTPMNEAQFKAFAPLIVATYQGLGEREKLAAFLYNHLDALSSSDELFTAFSYYLFEENTPDKRAYTLPSGALNNFLLSKMIAMREYGRGEYIYDIISNKQAHGEQALLLANCHVPINPSIYRTLLNNYLRAFNAPLIQSVDFTRSNVLLSLTFADAPAIDAPHKVSILIAGYNCANTVAYALRSLLHQSYRNIEILFCDDASSDDTLAIVQQFATDPRLRIFTSASNQGSYNIRNQLMNHATGDYIAFHDSDDYALPTRIEQQMELMIHQTALLCIGKWLRVHPDGTVLFHRDHKAMRLCMNSMLFRREVVDIVGAYRSVLCGADSEFFEKARALLGDEAIIYLNAPLVLGLCAESCITRLQGSEALETGYRAPARHAYAEIASRQRLLGTDIVSDEEIDEVNKASGIYREPQEITLLVASPSAKKQTIASDTQESDKPKGFRKWLK